MKLILNLLEKKNKLFEYITSSYFCGLVLTFGLLILSIGTLYVIYVGDEEGTSHPELKLVWEDNFDTLQQVKWHFETGNGSENEFQIFRKHINNAFIQDGLLKIKATTENSDLFQEGTSMVDEKQSKTSLFTYSAKLATNLHSPFARIEVCAKFPNGDRLKPVIKLRSNHSEIIIATRNSGLLDANSVQQRYSILTFTGYSDNMIHSSTGNHSSPDFHVYAFTRKKYDIIFEVDGRETGRMNLFTNSFLGPHLDSFESHLYNLEIYLAVGGESFNDFRMKNDPNKTRQDEEFFQYQNEYLRLWNSPTFEIDYVRQYG